MSEPVAIRGIGVVAGFGAGRDRLEAALQQPPGGNGIVQVDTADGLVERPAHVVDLAPAGAVFDHAALRRVDRFSQLAALGAHLALVDGGLEAVERRRVGLVLATGYGSCRTTFSFLAGCLDDGPSLASPLLFSSSGHSAALANTSILLGISGPVLTVCQAELAMATALASACQWLHEGRVDVVLVGGQDEISGPRSHVLEQLFGDANDGPMTPLELDRQSAVMGEGCAFLALTATGDAEPSAPRLAQVTCGHLSDGMPSLPTDAPVIIAADGHRSCSRHYRRALRRDAVVSAYAPLFGSLPTGMAFQLVVAALARRRGRLPAPPSRPSADFPAAVGGELALDGHALSCLECRGGGSYAMVTLPAP